MLRRCDFLSFPALSSTKAEGEVFSHSHCLRQAHVRDQSIRDRSVRVATLPVVALLVLLYLALPATFTRAPTPSLSVHAAAGGICAGLEFQTLGVDPSCFPVAILQDARDPLAVFVACGISNSVLWHLHLTGGDPTNMTAVPVAQAPNYLGLFGTAMLQDATGTIWITGNVASSIEGDSLSGLARFDPATGKLVPVWTFDSASNLLGLTSESDNSGRIRFLFLEQIGEDPPSRLWRLEVANLSVTTNSLNSAFMGDDRCATPPEQFTLTADGTIIVVCRATARSDATTSPILIVALPPASNSVAMLLANITDAAILQRLDPSANAQAVVGSGEEPLPAMVWISIGPLILAVSLSPTVAAQTPSVSVIPTDCLFSLGFISPNIGYDSKGHVLYFVCDSGELLALQLQLPEYRVFARREISSSCEVTILPLLVRWDPRESSQLLIVCADGNVQLTAGVSVTRPISKLVCSKPTLVDAEFDRNGDTAVVFGCASGGATTTITMGERVSSSPDFSCSYGNAHALESGTGVLFSLCFDTPSSSTLLRRLPGSTKPQVWFSCPAVANLNIVTPGLSRSQVAVDDATVVFRCPDSAWRMGTHSPIDTVPPQAQMLLNTSLYSDHSVLLDLVASVAFVMVTIDAAKTSMAIFSVAADSTQPRLMTNPDCRTINGFAATTLRGRLQLFYGCATPDLDLDGNQIFLHRVDVETGELTVLVGFAPGIQDSSRFWALDLTSGVVVAQVSTQSFIVVDADNRVQTRRLPCRTASTGGVQSTRFEVFLAIQGVFYLACDVIAGGSWSLLSASLDRMLDTESPFLPLVTTCSPICGNQPLTKLLADPSGEMLFAECAGDVMAITRGFRCYGGESWVQGQCTPCEPGQSKLAMHALNMTTPSLPLAPLCTPCPPQSIAPSSSSFVCTVCALGTVSDARSLACFACPRDSYTPFSGSDCYSCEGDRQDGLECSGGLASVRAGYFAYLSGESPSIFHTVRCPRGFCPGSPLQLQVTHTDQARQGIESDAADAGITYCVYPRVNLPTNFLCGECDVANGYIPWGSQCAHCTAANGGLVVLLFAFSFVLVFCLLVSAVSSTTSSTANSGSSPALGGQLAILLYFAQTSSLELGPLSSTFTFIHWSNLGIASAGGGSGISNECIAPLTPIQQIALTITTPLMLLGWLIVIGCGHALLSSLRSRCGSTISSSLPDTQMMQLSSSPPGKFDQLGIEVSEHNLSSDSRGVPSSVAAEVKPENDVSDRTQVVQPKPAQPLENTRTIACSDSFAGVISSASFEVTPVSMTFASSSLRRDARWGLLWRSYAPHAWFWSALVLIRRSLFIVVAVFLDSPDHIAERFVLFTLLHLASGLLLFWTQPYQHASLNRADGASHVLLLVLSVVLVLQEEASLPVWLQVCIALLLAGTILGMVIWMATAKLGAKRSNDASFHSWRWGGGAAYLRALLSLLRRSLRQVANSPCTLDRYIGGVVAILLFSYTSVISASLAALQCVELDQLRLVFTQPTIDCDSTEYRSLRSVLIAVLCVYGVGFPVGCFVIARRMQGQAGLTGTGKAEPNGLAMVEAHE